MSNKTKIQYLMSLDDIEIWSNVKNVRGTVAFACDKLTLIQLISTLIIDPDGFDEFIDCFVENSLLAKFAEEIYE